MTDNERALEACPFCGGDAEYIEKPLQDNFTDRIVRCVECDIQTEGEVCRFSAIKAWNTRAALSVEGPVDRWQPIETAPKDGTVIEILEYHPEMPCLYTGWWMEYGEYQTQDGAEYEGLVWVLNDDDNHMIEEDSDLSKWFWKPLQIPNPPKEKDNV